MEISHRRKKLTLIAANEPIAMTLEATIAALQMKQVVVAQQVRGLLFGTVRRSSSWYDTNDHEMADTPSTIFHTWTAVADKGESLL